ncbi:putative GAF sensor protein [Linderina pennispora]|uniref:Putative GAF sensor protein n=1 Tax=Linderina pennispora TaxID=61395 RepID=A0A1Y1W2P4_9FUNG|nr:putative GAF sensor protein [Linderina pennispora]ORX67823.1 putative GAF sensor protein [Linderina pennispora]
MSFIPGFHNTTSPKRQFYMDLMLQCTGLLQGQRNLVTNTANISSLVYHSLLETPTRADKPVNWVGFYFQDSTNPDSLILGPFQGKPACTQITFGRGVCGTAAKDAKSVVVADVHEFPGHIACDAASNSEIVVPLKAANGGVLGVFDIDSSVKDAFDDDDRIGLEAIANLVVEASDF